MAESTPVNIKIEVTDANSAAVVGSVTKNMEQMGMAGANTGRQMAQGMATGAAGVRAMSADIAAMQARQKAVIEQLNAWKPRDTSPQGMFNERVTALGKQGVNGLAAQEAAIASVTKTLGEQEAAAAANAATTKAMAGAYGEARIAMGAFTGNTRQMEMGLANVGSRLKFMAPLWGAAMDATIAVAAVALVAQMGGAVYDLYEKWVDTDAAIDKYNDKAAEAAAKKFDESRSIQQLNNDLKTSNELIDQLNKKRSQGPSIAEIIASAQAPGGAGFQTYRGENFGMTDANNLNQAHGKKDIAAISAEQKSHQDAIQNIRDQAMVTEAGLAGIAKARAAKKAAHDEADEQVKSDIAYQKLLAAVSERAGRKPGDDGYVPEPGAHDFDPEKKAAYAKADATYKAAQIEDARSLNTELAHLHEQADEASLSGLNLLEYQRKAADAEFVRAHGVNTGAIADIDRRYYADEKKQIDQEAQDRAKADLEAQQQQTEGYFQSLNEFANRVDRMMEQSADRGKSGFARIHADAQRQIEDLQRSAPAGSPDLARGEAGIRGNEAQSVAALQQKNGAETAQIQDQAQAKFLSAERQQTLAIESEYNQRLEKFKEELLAQEIDQQDYDKRAIAAAQERDAELVNSAREAREKMAGEFTGLFHDLDHPLKGLQEMGEKIGGQAAAALTQRIENAHGGSGASGSGFDITNPLGGAFDKLAGKPRGYGQKPESGASVLAAARSIAVSQAAIHVASASISVGGGMPTGAAGAAGAAGISASGTYAAGGGTYAGGSSASGTAGAAVPVSSGGTGASAWSSGGGTSGGGFSGGAGAGGNFDVNQMATPLPGGVSTSGTAGAGGLGALGGAQPIAPPKSNVAGNMASNLSSGMNLYKQSMGISGSGRAAGSAGAGGLGALGRAQPIAPPKSNVAGNMASNLSSGMNLYKQSMGISGSGGAAGSAGAGGNFDVNQMAVPAGPDAVLAEAKAAPGAHASLDTTDADSLGGAGTGMFNGGGFDANFGGAVSGAIGVYGAYEGNGGVGGALSGASSGMQLGMALGGPMGAGIGAAGGAVLGAIGMGGREKARVYDLKQVRPQMAAEQQAYQTGSTDYLTAYSDMQSLDTTAERTTKQWGPAAHAYYNDTIRTEIAQARGKFDQMEKAGRGNAGASPAQYSMGTDSVPAMLTPNERVISAPQNERITRALENGASATSRPVATGFGGDVHLHVHTMDAGGVARFLDDNKHGIRAAVNASYAQNSGGADAGF